MINWNVDEIGSWETNHQFATKTPHPNEKVRFRTRVRTVAHQRVSHKAVALIAVWLRVRILPDQQFFRVSRMPARAGALYRLRHHRSAPSFV
jgi:hypothetical protein